MDAKVALKRQDAEASRYHETLPMDAVLNIKSDNARVFLPEGTFTIQTVGCRKHLPFRPTAWSIYRCDGEKSTARSARSQSVQSTTSQLSMLSRMIRRCLSICHSAYKCRAAPAALRCAGPTPPCRASCCDRQTQVARFLPSLSGLPNQYLEVVSRCVPFCHCGGIDILQKSTTGRRLGMGGLV